MKELNQIKDLFYDNPLLFKKLTHFDKHRYSIDQLDLYNMPKHPFFGRCFCMSKFIKFFYSDMDLTLKCKNNGIEFCQLTSGEVLTTSHWWVEDAEGKIYDISKDQFIYNYPNLDLYSNGRVRELGQYHFGAKDNKSKRYDTLVPSSEVMKFAIRYKEIYGSARGLDYWIEEYKEWKTIDKWDYSGKRR